MLLMLMLKKCSFSNAPIYLVTEKVTVSFFVKKKYIGCGVNHGPAVGCCGDDHDSSGCGGSGDLG